MIHTQKRIRCVFSIDNSRISFCELISWSSHINSNQILNTSSTGNHYNIIKAPKSIQIKFKFKKKTNQLWQNHKMCCHHKTATNFFWIYSRYFECISSKLYPFYSQFFAKMFTRYYVCCIRAINRNTLNLFSFFHENILSDLFFSPINDYHTHITTKTIGFQ